METIWDAQSSLYVLTLIACILVGTRYRALDTPRTRRKVGAGVGALTVLVLSGTYICHAAILVAGNMVIYKYCDRRKIHQMSLAYTWLYLVYLHSCQGPRYMMFIMQSLALRMTGLAFEIHAAPVVRVVDDKDKEAAASATDQPPALDYSLFTELDSFNILSYAFFYVGIHRGPYYTWKIFHDHFEARSDIQSWATYRREATIVLLKKTAVCCVSFAILQCTVSKKAYFNPDFYTSYGTDYRFLYNIPQLLMYILHYQIVILLCTIECCESGFAVYPASHVYTVSNLSFTPASMRLPPTDMPLEEESNIVYIKCYDKKKMLYGPTLIDFLKGWDIPSRYWFETHIYKTMTRAKTELRTASSFFLWFVWRGPHLSQLLLTVTLWCYCHLEREYEDLYKPTGSMRSAFNVGYSIMRLFCLVYITPCLIIRKNQCLIRYYSSIYWIFHWLLLVLLIFAVIIYKKKQRETEYVQRLTITQSAAQQN